MILNKKILIFACLVLFSLSFASAISITDVSSSPSEIVPGEIVKISIEVENIFNYDVTDINVKLELEDVPFAPYQSSSEKYLDELDEDDDEDFDFKLIVLPTAQSGIYKIPVTIDYIDDKDDDETKEDLISITVNSAPELKASLESSTPLIKGKENEFSIKIVNSGLSDAKFVFITASEVTGIKFSSGNEKYIGDIDSDDFYNEDYRAYIASDAPNSINVPVILNYRDSTNKEFTEVKNIILRTYSLAEAQELGLVKKPNYTIYIVAVIVIAGWFGWRKYKKIKLKKRK